MTLTHEKDDEIIAMLEDEWNTDYGVMNWNEKELRLATGGWSENEAIIDKLMNSMFWLKYWKSSSRGGLYIFDYPKREE